MNQSIAKTMSAIRLRLAALRTRISAYRLKQMIRYHRTAARRQYQAFEKALANEVRRDVAYRRVAAPNPLKPLLPLQNAAGVLRESKSCRQISRVEKLIALERHKNGDWGLVDLEDWQRNNRNLRSGRGELISKYAAADGVVFGLYTDGGHTCTTMFTKEDFVHVGLQNQFEKAC